MQAKSLISAAVCVIALALAQTVATTAYSGTSCADCSSSNKAAFSVENTTNVTVYYDVKWGDHQWKRFTLNKGEIYTHSFGVDGYGSFPGPKVRFDRIGGDDTYTEKEYPMNVNIVGSGGYGSSRSEPKKYYFKYRGTRLLEIYAE
jgi:hypothetical protein